MDPISNRFANLSPLKQALLALEDLQARLAKSEGARTEPIAIIGMGCRFPGASDPKQFWRLLQSGEDAVREVPCSRWNIEDYYDPDPDAPGKMSTRWGGFLEQVDQFDPEFFGISPREAVAMDPQHRLLLEVAWEALENAGQGPRELAACQTGVFIGITGDEYAQLFHRQHDLSVFNAYFASGIARSVASGRISYMLGVQGPNLAIDTACSSSLVAVHTACLNLRMGECRMALAGGSNVILSPEIGVTFSKAHMMAADGRCKTFDSRADGFVRGEGCGVVVLKRLSDAQADGDRILALIRGSSVNQDGRSSGLTVPNRRAQEAVIRQALANGHVQPLDIGYVEAHGTGTALGDPIEAHALAAALGTGRTPENPLVVGSVKTNLGHLESTAGIAGLIKVVLALEHQEIPRHLHFQSLNPHIDWRGVPMEIPLQPRSWPRGGKKRLAGVSAFGFSGTNAHVIVDEAPVQPDRERKYERPLRILALSARSQSALEKINEQYVERLRGDSEGLGDICFTANAGRALFEYRLAVSAGTPEELHRKLSKAPPGERIRDRDGVRAVFLFSGQGSQYAGMGKQLYETQPVFRRALDECAALLKDELEQPLTEVLWGGAPRMLDQTAYTQPALFAVEYALAELWKSWGIEPSIVLGHSVGEYAAACVAGVYSLADGIGLIAARGRLMQGVSGQGAMSAVLAGENRVREALEGLDARVSLAAMNAPESVVISGYEAELSIAEDRLRGSGVRVQRLAVSHAFHSPQMREIEAAFEAVAGRLRYAAPRVGLISSATGRALSRDEMSEPGYWRRQITQPVRFREAMQTLRTQGCTVFLEVGPGTTLAGLGRQCIGGEESLWATSLKQGRDEWEQIMEGLGRLYVRGAEVNWAAFDHPYGRRRVTLPTYPFERQRYWIEGDQPRRAEPPALGGGVVKGNSAAHPLLGRRTELAGDPKTLMWENQISTRDFPYLADHRAFGNVIFPLTAYLEWMTAAAADSQSGEARLEDIVVGEPLVLTDRESKTVQLILRDGRFEIHSREGERWKRHITARVAQPRPVPERESREKLEERMPRQSDVDAFYEAVSSRGMGFGPAFRSIRSLCSGIAESLAFVASADTSGDSYGIHPALLDGCFQALGAVLPDKDGLYPPIGLEYFALWRSAGPQAWSHVRLRDGMASEAVVVDVTVFDDKGIVADARGLSLRRATRTALQRHLSRPCENALFELHWHTASRAAALSEISGDWLIVADHTGVAGSLAERLEARGAHCTIPDRALLVKTEITEREWQGVVHLAALDARTDDAPAADALNVATLEESLRSVCESALTLVQGLASAEGKPPRLWIVTCGAQAVRLSLKGMALAQATLWGMAQAIMEEHPEWSCTCIDLDPGVAKAISVSSLFGRVL